MNLFYEDVWVRRALAASARRRVNGRRGRRCSLPSDGLTAAQRDRLNGPVRTYAMARPMGWKQFQDMPMDLQEIYLTRLRERFGLGLKAMGERVLGCGDRLTAYVRERGLALGAMEERTVTPEQEEALRAWLAAGEAERKEGKREG